MTSTNLNQEEGGAQWSRVATPTTTRKFSLLHTLEFDSDRKRMSVVVRDEEGSVMLVTKAKTTHVLLSPLNPFRVTLLSRVFAMCATCQGAESSVLPRCRAGPLQATNRSIDKWALVGLRTLALAVRHLRQARQPGSAHCHV